MPPLTDRIGALKQAIQSTLLAITESREQVQHIHETTLDEVKRLEQAHDQVRAECDQAITKVEELELLSRTARERLMDVNRDVNKYSENQMKAAYDKAQQLQIELGQWREREIQLRFRRDDIARRLKALRVTAQHAEILMAKFNYTSQYLSTEFGDMVTVLESAQVQSILGLQMLQLQEEERRWLAAQLHDGPMQTLASIGMRMQAATPETVVDVRRRLNTVIGDLRQMVFDLRPPLLDDLGLVPTLKRYCQQWSESTHIGVRIQLVGLETSLAPTEKITVFRCVQEALKNIAYHSGANNVDITLTFGIQELQITVTDNGKGIGEVTWLDWLDVGKLGLTLCRQRMGALGGSFDVTSAQTSGTMVTLALPIQRRSE